MTTRPATLADVAALAGVSGKTVSRVANGDPNVSAATKEKVETAIARTGFRLNLAARALAASSSFLIGIFSTELSSWYYAELFRGAASACRRLGYHLVVEEFAVERDLAHHQAALPDLYGRALAHIAYHGLILPPPHGDDMELLDALDARGVRYVRIAPATEPDRSSAVFADDAAGVTVVTEHLWRVGHRRFGVVVGPEQHRATQVRRDAVIAAVRAAGGAADTIAVEPLAYVEDIIARGQDAAARLLSGETRPTAIFAFNDEIAAGVMLEARARGLTIPGDLAVAGFDDSDIAKLTWPPLTTVRQPVREMAQAAVELLVAGNFPLRRDLAVEPILRGSTDKA